MPYARISAPVDCKDPAWQPLLDVALNTGTVKALKGITPAGLPHGGYWEYRKRCNGGRKYLMYNVPVAPDKRNKRTYVIGSVNPEYAEEALAWKPQPNCERLFNFASGAVLVRYDALALPERITPL